MGAPEPIAAGGRLARLAIARRPRLWQDARRIALVGPTFEDARDIMVEGDSGILAVSPPAEGPRYVPSKRRVVWPNGAIAALFSADEPRRLRGPQHDTAWCDELAAWRKRRGSSA